MDKALGLFFLDDGQTAGIAYHLLSCNYMPAREFVKHAHQPVLGRSVKNCSPLVVRVSGVEVNLCCNLHI